MGLFNFKRKKQNTACLCLDEAPSVGYNSNDFWIEGDLLIKYYGKDENVVLSTL